MQIVSLSSLIEAATEEGEVQEYLSSFLCRNNNDVESFLHNNAIENEQRSFTRTSLVIDEKNNNEIVGYFTLMIKAFSFLEDVSGEMKKRVTNNKKAEVFNSILIAQLGRSDRYKGVISGSVILNFALQNCILIYNLAGLRLVCVEYDPITVLNDFYLSNKFKLLQTNLSGKLLAYLKL